MFVFVVHMQATVIFQEEDDAEVLRSMESFDFKGDTITVVTAVCKKNYDFFKLILHETLKMFMFRRNATNTSFKVKQNWIYFWNVVLTVMYLQDCVFVPPGSTSAKQQKKSWVMFE